MQNLRLFPVLCLFLYNLLYYIHAYQTQIPVKNILHLLQASLYEVSNRLPLISYAPVPHHFKTEPRRIQADKSDKIHYHMPT